MIKGDGGAIGITENEAALRKWMMAGPEVGMILMDYEARTTTEPQDDGHHHEQIPNIQRAFFNDVKNVVEVIENQGNPFADDKSERVTLDTKMIMGDVVQTVKTAEAIGVKQYQTFISEQLAEPSKSSMILFIKKHSSFQSRKKEE